MIEVNHEQVFFEFVKQHDLLKHLKYTETKRQDQEIIGLMVPSDDQELFVPFVRELLKEEDTTIIDPNYDEIYNNFINLDHNLDSIEHIKQIIGEITTKEELVDFIVSFIIKPLIDSNINAKKVYFIVKPYWVTDWCDKIIEIE